ncbi:1-aminocyclopropane-1-carboxylate deaminase/D-cysteine desulfhydrase [Pseudomonas boanensis]|uniref:1-aminocyclopropane-1-carboxylate deaminase/D-cysteine desulfhydrase n=1 Tax=Metapseudomonas boanensis TaxID=2822138 RepID=UPI0035D452B5
MHLPDWKPRAELRALPLSWLDAAGVEVAMLHLEEIDALISGNKWFKLAPHLERACQEGADGVVSLGGAHSNHLHALAAAGKRFGFPTVGLLRGEPQDTETVQELQAFGMQLHWLGYGAYRSRHQAGFWAPWLQRYPGYVAVPEGGGGLDGAHGCMGLVMMIREQLESIGWKDYDALWLAAGTGTTLAGLVLGEVGRHPVYGALAVPPGHGVDKQVRAILQQAGVPDEGYHLVDASRGGFARLDVAVARCLLETEQEAGVTLEPLYTAKVLLALREQVEAGDIPRGSRLVVLHTGGLQGRRSLELRLQQLASAPDPR